MAWSLDRRDFIAAEREDLASEREKVADLRNETAGLRERLADDRERETLDREQRHNQPRRTGERATERSPSGGREHASRSERRAEAEHRRELPPTSPAGRGASSLGHRQLMGPQAYGPTLVASFAELARQLFSSEDLADELPHVLKFTVGAVAGCDWAALTPSTGYVEHPSA